MFLLSLIVPSVSFFAGDQVGQTNDSTTFLTRLPHSSIFTHLYPSQYCSSDLCQHSGLRSSYSLRGFHGFQAFTVHFRLLDSAHHVLHDENALTSRGSCAMGPLPLPPHTHFLGPSDHVAALWAERSASRLPRATSHSLCLKLSYTSFSIPTPNILPEALSHILISNAILSCCSFQGFMAGWCLCSSPKLPLHRVKRTSSGSRPWSFTP